MSIALSILDAVAARCAYIRKENGYNTDAGLDVRREWQRLNSDEVSASGTVIVYDTEDAPEEEDAYLDQMMIRALVTIEAAIDAGSDPTTRAHAMIADLKRAILPERTLGGTTLDLAYGGRNIQYPEQGQSVLIVSLSITALYRETRGLP